MMIDLLDYFYYQLFCNELPEKDLNVL
jgi:hypothetical protein